MAMVRAAVEEGSVAKRFWISSRKEAAFAKYTPFVVCLAAGRLEIEVFRNCIAQDVHFLKTFAQAYEMAEECAADDDDKAAITNIRKAVLDGLETRNSFVQEWGVDPTKDVIPIPATAKYIDFLLATAVGKVEEGKAPRKIATPFEKTKIPSYTVGAIIPLARLYAFLGKELQMCLPHDENDHPYKKWIDDFSSESFEAAAAQIDELLDKLSVALTGEELEVIGKLYHQAMKLAIEFFSAQPIVQPTVVPLTSLHDPANHLVIFSDFDLACTVVDSSAILAEIAILTAAKTDHNLTDNLNAQKTSSEMRNYWDSFSRQYTEEYEQCIESLLPKEAKMFDYEGLYKSLGLLSDFEKRANSRVIESEVLKGINLDDIKRAGECLMLRDGCTDFFRNALKSKDKLDVGLHVLSYCWCADLIRSAFSSGCSDCLNIHSNEFSYQESISTGEIVGKIESPTEKLETFKSILSKFGSNENHLSVYIGDSVGDLLCLLEADVGIVIGSNASLRRVGKQFGVSFVPLFPSLVNKQRELTGKDSSIWKRLSGVLYTVSSWFAFKTGILYPAMHCFHVKAFVTF